MMICRGGEDGKDGVFILGLSQENITRLINGEPIRLRPETHPGVPQGWDIFILYGQTEGEMIKQLVRGGSVDMDTKIKKDPRL